MKTALLSCACRWLAVAFLAVFVLWQGARTAWPYIDSKGAYSYLGAWRSAAKNAPGERIGLLCNDVGDISPTDRSRMIAIAWERTAMPPLAVDRKGEFGSVDCVLASAWISRIEERRLKDCGFAVVSANEYVKTWCRPGVPMASNRGRALSAPLPREIAVLGVEFALTGLLLAFVLGLRGCGIRVLAASIAVAACLGFVALSHPLLAPNGLGVYGGKARMLLECGGAPDGFWTSSQYAVLQPSYPPGLTALAYFHFLLSGGCGDRLVQFLVVLAMLALCISLLRKSNRAWGVFPVAAYCLSPVAVRMSAGFYAEPFAALLLVLGWSALDEGKLRRGALLMGAAALFRLEAASVAVAFAAGRCMSRGSISDKLRVMLLAALPGFAWHLVCKAMGCCGPSDWNFASVPDLGNIACALSIEAKTLALHVLPIVAMALLVRPLRELRNAPTLVASLASVAFILCTITIACGFHASPHSHWMMDNTVPRVLWYVSAIPILCLVSRCRTAVDSGAADVVKYADDKSRKDNE
ncbi:MAG: hypothetical protein E7049_12875 [Lentisphaerae bacterium]|nr:hypothetical protein [Lentisphaerota bacterium]